KLNVRKIYHLSTGNSLFEACSSNLVDFVGERIVAYLLLSAASAAAPSITLIRAVEKSFGTYKKASSMSSASTEMAFLAFFPFALAAVLFGYKLSTKTYV
ncbi:hypothetical protein MKX01_000562, partial [Papaver californicum]